MNIEMSFIRTEKRESIIDIITSRIKLPADKAGNQSAWGLSSSYDVLIAPDKKRKVAVSPMQNGWVAIVESKEIIDFTLLQNISGTLNTDVVAIQISDVVGACGYAFCRDGVVLEKYFNETDEDPIATARNYLKKNGIQFDVLTFREAVQLRLEGWDILNANNN